MIYYLFLDSNRFNRDHNEQTRK